MSGSDATLLYDSTFSRTVWRLYGGAKDLVMWYRSGSDAAGIVRDALMRPVRRLQVRDKSDCHFRKTGTEYDRKTGIKWLSCTEK
jgi:hypothetical protein